MVTKKLAIASALIAATMPLTACVKISTSSDTQNRPDSGFFVSLDKGDSWKQQTAILSTGGNSRNFSMESIASLAIDPTDHKAIYLGTYLNGLLYSLDQGAAWQVALSLGPGTVNSIAVDPFDKCTVYASIGNKVFRTNDCLRTWKTVFTDASQNIQVTSVNIDSYNSKNVYIALTRGDLVKSADKGDSWQTIYRFGSKIKKYAIDPNDTRRMYADTAKDGLNISENGGESWRSIKNVFEENKISGEIVDIELVKKQPDLIYLATERGILYSKDKGKTWAQMKLIPPSNNAAIDSLAVNPQNTNEIFYAAAMTFYRSVDGGNHWATKPLPSTKKVKDIEIDDTDPRVIYLALSKI